LSESGFGLLIAVHCSNILIAFKYYVTYACQRYLSATENVQITSHSVISERNFLDKSG